MDERAKVELERIRSQERLEKARMQMELKLAKEETKRVKAQTGNNISGVLNNGVNSMSAATQTLYSETGKALDKGLGHVADLGKNSNIKVDVPGVKVGVDGKGDAVQPSSAFGR